MPQHAFIRYIQTISNDVTRVFPQLMPPLVSHVCHCSGPDLFLCDHKFIIACASQLRLVAAYINVLHTKKMSN
jgi:hypothetical protein